MIETRKGRAQILSLASGRALFRRTEVSQLASLSHSSESYNTVGLEIIAVKSPCPWAACAFELGLFRPIISSAPG